MSDNKIVPAKGTQESQGSWTVDPATGRKVYHPHLVIDDGTFDRRLSLILGIVRIVLVALGIVLFVLILPTLDERTRYLLAAVSATMIWRFRRYILRRF